MRTTAPSITRFTNYIFLDRTRYDAYCVIFSYLETNLKQKEHNLHNNFIFETIIYLNYDTVIIRIVIIMTFE